MPKERESGTATADEWQGRSEREKKTREESVVIYTRRDKTGSILISQ